MKSTHLLMFVLSLAVPAAAARANHQIPLQEAACAYHDAVKKFECAVRESPFVDECDLRLVARLRQASCDLHTATQTPGICNRVLLSWRDVKILHRRVELSIFGRSCYRTDPALVHCWRQVSCALRELGSAVQCALRTALRPPIAPTCGGPVGFPTATFPGIDLRIAIPGAGAVPRAALPGAAPLPSATFPSTTLPQTFAPAPTHPQIDPRLNSRIDPRIDPRFDPRVDPRVRPRPTTPADQIRYFGRRPQNHSGLDRHSADAHLIQHDLRSAMIGAMLSRLAR